jgi:hypothetical protein
LLFGSQDQVVLLALLAAIAFGLPNSQAWARRCFARAEATAPASRTGAWIPAWLPAGAGGAVLGLLLCYCLQSILAGAPTEFLYFQF